MQDLKPYHTFHIAVKAQAINLIRNVTELKDWLHHTQQIPRVFIGRGSDILFCEDFQGAVAINKMQGIEISEDENYHYLHIAGGECWHSLVEFTVDKNIGGLENLALIPSSVGAAPIQNIGAYGIEFCDICNYVDTLDLNSLEIQRFKAEECQFSYRESIFKHQHKQDRIILAVGIKLSKNWQPQLSYGELKNLNPHNLNPKMVFNKICEIRRSKLPDPDEQGNAGSFFKNPVVTPSQFQALQATNPAVPYYELENGNIKIPAGWLIDQCGLKGFTLGGAQVHPLQALVLINANHASSKDIIALAKIVRQRVMERFAIDLEPEVRFWGAQGEISPISILS